MSLIHFFFDEHEVLPLLLWAPLVKSRGGWTCEECGFYASPETREHYPTTIVAHHRDGNRRLGNHTLANGQVLCTRCHAQAHKKLREPGDLD